MRDRILTLLLFCVLLALGGIVHAGGLNWKDHAAPFDFLFGNHIDTHQQTHLVRAGKNKGDLAGYFYVVHLDQDGDGLLDTTADGLPILRHCTKPEHYPNCRFLWTINAKPCIKEVNGCEAMNLYHKHDHPVWLIGPRQRSADGETFLAGTRSQIPQPGVPGHFHWLTEGSEDEGELLPSSLNDIEALFNVDIEVPEGCNVSRASQIPPGTICPGYFLELRVVQGPTVAFHHGGENIVLNPGYDLRSHLNFVTSYVADPDIGLDDLNGDSNGDGGSHDNGDDGGGSH